MDVKKAEHRRIDAFELWCWRRLLRVPWTARRSNQSWVFFGRNDAKAETPVLWAPHVKSWRIGKDSDAGRDWGQEEKGTTEDEMAGWHHRLDGRKFDRTLGVGGGQGGLACCDSWGHKESDTTERLNWTELTSLKEAAFISMVKSIFSFSLSLLKLLLLLLSRFSRIRLCATPKTAAHQAPPSLRFSRQEHRSGFPFLSPMHESEKWKWSHSVVSNS